MKNLNVVNHENAVLSQYYRHSDGYIYKLVLRKGKLRKGSKYPTTDFYVDYNEDEYYYTQKKNTTVQTR